MMDTFNKSFRQRLIALAGSMLWMLSVGSPVLADDTDIFFGQTGDLTNNNPNVLLIIDSSSSMDDPVVGDTRDRLRVVQDVAIDLISELKDINVGLMKFDYNDRRRPTEFDSSGGMVVYPISDVEANLTELTKEINDVHHYGWTPLSETYYEAAAYYLGLNVEYGRNSYEGYTDWRGRDRVRRLRSHPDSRTNWVYDSPITGSCQKNYIIYLSDGEPTQDNEAEDEIEDLLTDNSYGKQDATECVNDHGDTNGMCIDELAEFLFKNDFSPEPGVQNVISHFIAFDLDLPIFEDAAEAGGGLYYTANNADELREKLSELLVTVAEADDGFTAPAITVNAFDRSSHLDQLYFTVFKPSVNNRWDGNLKKYKVNADTTSDGLVIVGQDGEAAVDPVTGFFFNGRNINGDLDPNVPTAWSYWSSSPDGADVTLGGVASQLDEARKIYTNNGGGRTVSSLQNSTPFLNALSAVWTPNDANVLSAAEWFDWANGIDVADSDSDGKTDDARQQIGAPLHSKPAVVVYGGTDDDPDVKLFIGTNDGYLHAVDGKTGDELWAFMPYEMWDNVPVLAENRRKTGDIPYGIDGHITVRKGSNADGSADFVDLMFGMRRGGNRYYMLDVTEPTAAPKIKWHFETSGQSWSRPVFATINLGTEGNPDPREVVIVGGGYDTKQDSARSYQDDNVGNAIHVIDVETGVELWRASGEDGGPDGSLVIPEMKSSIPSAVRALDMNLDGYVDRLYVNDIAGRLFRFDVHNEDWATEKVTGGMIASVGGAETGNASNNRRFYYAPDVTLGSENGVQFLTITMASGFRAKPLESRIKDYLIGIRDYYPFRKIGLDNPITGEEAISYDFDTTISNMQNLGTSGTTVVSPGVNGWYRPLGVSEKSLAASKIFQNKAFYTTYTPGEAPDSNPCAPAVGTGKLITIDLTSGSVTENTLQKPGIPPEVTFLFGESVGGEQQYTCFGNNCSYTSDPNDPNNPINLSDEDDGPERQIQCLAGPESCDANATEVPQRTFWRQTTVD